MKTHTITEEELSFYQLIHESAIDGLNKCIEAIFKDDRITKEEKEEEGVRLRADIENIIENGAKITHSLSCP